MHSVTANPERFVAGSSQLSGILPTQLGSISSLKLLDVFNTRISGTLPTELAQLTDLEQILTAGSLLTGVVPPAVCDLPNLDSICTDATRVDPGSAIVTCNCDRTNLCARC